MAHAPDDELLSALLDGESAPGDVSHVSTCDVCQARLADLRRVAATVATPVAMPPGHVREAALTEAALATGTTRRRRTSITPIGRRAAGRRRTSPLSAAAALLVAVLAGGWALSAIGNGGGTTDNLATSADTEAASALPNIGSAFAADDAGSGASFAPLDGGDLGAVDDIAVVEASYEAAGTQRGKSAATSNVECPVPEGTTMLFHAALTYRGEPAEAHVVEATDATRSTRILRAADCSLIVSRDFAPTSQR